MFFVAWWHMKLEALTFFIYIFIGRDKYELEILLDEHNITIKLYAISAKLWLWPNVVIRDDSNLDIA